MPLKLLPALPDPKSYLHLWLLVAGSITILTDKNTHHGVEYIELLRKRCFRAFAALISALCMLQCDIASR